MKKGIVLLLLFIGFRSFGQVTKADFDAIFVQFPFEKMEKIIVNNVRVYYTDGTNNWSYFTYKTGVTGYEIKNNSFYIKSYKDYTKTTVSGFYIIPFEKMTAVSAGENSISIQLIQ